MKKLLFFLLLFLFFLQIYLSVLKGTYTNYVTLV